jgi:hypothetical protein
MASWQLSGRFITATKHFPDFQLPRAQHSQTRHISICFFFLIQKENPQSTFLLTRAKQAQRQH